MKRYCNLRHRLETDNFFKSYHLTEKRSLPNVYLSTLETRNFSGTNRTEVRSRPQSSECSGWRFVSQNLGKSTFGTKRSFSKLLFCRGAFGERVVLILSKVWTPFCKRRIRKSVFPFLRRCRRHKSTKRWRPTTTRLFYWSQFRWSGSGRFLSLWGRRESRRCPSVRRTS